MLAGEGRRRGWAQVPGLTVDAEQERPDGLGHPPRRQAVGPRVVQDDLPHNAVVRRVSNRPHQPRSNHRSRLRQRVEIVALEDVSGLRVRECVSLMQDMHEALAHDVPLLRWVPAARLDMDGFNVLRDDFGERRRARRPILLQYADDESHRHRGELRRLPSVFILRRLH